MTDARCLSRRRGRRCDLTAGHADLHRTDYGQWDDDGRTPMELGLERRSRWDEERTRANKRSAIALPDDCWEFVERIALRDGTSRSGFIEGLILLAKDAEEKREADDLHARANAIRERHLRTVPPVAGSTS